MSKLTVKWRRTCPLKTTRGRCKYCGEVQVFHLEPDDQEFDEWVSFCLHCDGTTTFTRAGL